ncbi:MAG: TetR/AcrR family transcriptional regulator [Candidatus Acidiferrales bacterium]
MPRAADQNLEKRILTAARRLCHARGVHGLTLRAVARAAGTTTPTVYKRFRNKEALRTALSSQIRDEMFEFIFAAPGIEQIYRRYVQFIEENSEDYEVLQGTQSEILAPETGRPGKTRLLAELSRRFGGKPEDYELAFYALFLLCQGAASFMGVGSSPDLRAEMREQCVAVCDRLLQHMDILRNQ